jgi:hypothetical protein
LFREIAEAVLDQLVLERVKGDDDDASAWPEQRDKVVEEALELAELIIDGDAQLSSAAHRRQ